MIERRTFVNLVTITWGSPSPTRTSCRWIGENTSITRCVVGRAHGRPSPTESRITIKDLPQLSPYFAGGLLRRLDVFACFVLDRPKLLRCVGPKRATSLSRRRSRSEKWLFVGSLRVHSRCTAHQLPVHLRPFRYSGNACQSGGARPLAHWVIRATPRASLVTTPPPVFALQIRGPFDRHPAVITGGALRGCSSPWGQGFAPFGRSVHRQSVAAGHRSWLAYHASAESKPYLLHALV
jgi:hypothetical protein